MKVLVLAGGYDQIALIQELKSRGHYVIMADYYDNPLAKPYADKHYQVSTLNEEAIERIALEEAIELITTACTDQALLTVAKVSSKLCLPCYISSKQAMQVTNKFYMKHKLLENNIPTAKAVFLDNEESWKEELKAYIELTFPAVVKPCDCNSSKGVEKVYSMEECMAAVERAFNISRSKKVIVEEFMEGKEISIDVWVNQSGAEVLSVSDTSKMPYSENQFTIYQSKYPVKGIDAIYDKIRKIADDIANAFDLADCPLLIQAILNNDEVYVIEFSARMGGGTKYKLIEYMAGVDIMNVYVNRILGQENQEVLSQRSGKCIELDYLYADNGTVTRLDNFQEAKDRNIIEDYFQYKSLGSIITDRKTSGDRVAGVLLTADTEEELINKRNIALSQVDILDGGKSILFKSCFGL